MTSAILSLKSLQDMVGRIQKPEMSGFLSATLAGVILVFETPTTHKRRSAAPWTPMTS
jgi:hypothetical protein